MPLPQLGVLQQLFAGSRQSSGWERLQPRREVASLTPTFPWEPSHGKGKRGADEGRTRAGTGCSAPLRHGAATGCAAGVPLLLFPPLSTPSDVAARGGRARSAVLEKIPAASAMVWVLRKGSELPEHLDNVVTYTPSRLPCTGQGISLSPLQGQGNQGRGRGESSEPRGSMGTRVPRAACHRSAATGLSTVTHGLPLSCLGFPTSVFVLVYFWTDGGVSES